MPKYKYKHKHARRKSRRGKKSMKQIATAVLNQSLEKYKIMSFINDKIIGSIRGGNRCLLFSLTGGETPGLASPLLTTSTDAGMKSLFSFTPLGGTTNPSGQTIVAGPSVYGGGGGGFGTGDSGQGTVQGTQTLRGRECKLLNWHYRLLLTQPDANASGTGTQQNQFCRIMIVETRRPISSAITGGTNWSTQLFYQQQVQTLVAGVGQPNEMTAFHNYDVIKKVHFDKLVKLTPGESGRFSYVRKGVIRIQRKAHWAMYYDTATPPAAHLQYMGPWLYMVVFSDFDIAEETQRPLLSLSSILTLQDA